MGDIATLVKTTTPSKLTQEQGDYATTVSAKVTNKDVGGTTRQVMSKINNLDKPNNVKVNIGGASDDINQCNDTISLCNVSCNHYRIFNLSYYI
ncbi:RND multidrug efflux transporter; Acriflavin resistance protein [Staphylococcus aureus]|uniref:RND multidrug efflux transporter Acriflavin resistance protein n=1 Tax=Staphylococcus aureus TaxID=1280 RepID=A0A380DS39_STAAU|nr:RND multidrug efflux transporter; Acriflavin resistance protein [Staphylococcus aureus]